MNILISFYFCYFLYAKSEILTHEGIYEELQSCQEQQITIQEKHYELHQHNSFIMIGFDNASDAFIGYLRDAIIDLLQKYVDVKKTCDMQITCRILNDLSDVEFERSIPKFFQNAYIFNHCKLNNYKTYNQMIRQFNFKIYHAIKKIGEINEIFNLHYQLKVQNELKTIDNDDDSYIRRKFHNIMLISNCLDIIEDYDLFYNECIKYSKMYLGKTSLVFIALKLNEREKITFNILQPWDDLVKINITNDMNLEYQTLFLEKRSPLGDFAVAKDIPCVLGRNVAKSRWKTEIESRDICFKKKVNLHFGNKQIINSMRCIIGRSEIICDGFLNLFFQQTGAVHLQEYVITLWCEDIFSSLYIFYTEKLIEDSETKKQKTINSTVFLCLCHGNYKLLLVKYSYYINLYNDEISFSLTHGNEVASDDLIHQHLKATKIIANLKSHMCNTLMHHDESFDIHKIIYNDNLYVPHSKSLTPSEILVSWDYANTYKSIDDLLSQIYNPGLNPTFVLYRYDLSTDNGFKINNNEKDIMFKNIKDFTKIKEISVGFKFDEIQKQQNYCLQICSNELNFTQYYYVFLPTYEFQLLKYGCDLNNSLLMFNELLEESKIRNKTKMPPIMSSFYNIVIDEIKQLKIIPKSTILLYLNNYSDPKINFFIYNVIAVNAKQFSRLSTLLNDLTEQEIKLLDELKIPCGYSEINIIKDALYQKIMINLYFKTFHSHVHHTIIECFQQILKIYSIKFFNKPKKICYLQCGNEFPALELRDRFLEILCGNKDKEKEK
ncbi:hypothetical protein COBT_002616 [Conglomerata obtusa]